jgi:hypothetical protein
MKKISLALLLLILVKPLTAQSTAENKTSSFNPVIKMKGLVHARFESSLTDSVDVQNKVSDEPVRSNFQIRRLELRADIVLNQHWSGVIRLQIPALKTSVPGAAMELAYFQWKYDSRFLIRGGQMKVPFELDELTSAEDLRMIDRGTTSRLLTGNSFTSYQPGVMVQGTFMEPSTPLSYYAGVFNGSDRTISADKNSAKNLIGRIEYNPIKTLRLGVNGQTAPFATQATGHAIGADVSLIQPLNDELQLILEGEYVQGTNINAYNSSADTVKDVDDFLLKGYFAQALLRIAIEQPWCKTLEVGGKFEYTDPTEISATNAYHTITGGIGFIFLPDNDARLQFNLVKQNWVEEIPGVQKNNLLFITQLQLKI